MPAVLQVRARNAAWMRPAERCTGTSPGSSRSAVRRSCSSRTSGTSSDHVTGTSGRSSGRRCGIWVTASRSARHLLPTSAAAALGRQPQVRERVFITATCADRGDSAHRDPVATSKPFDGWDPQAWHLESDLPLDPDHAVVGCELSEAERLWINAWDDFVPLIRQERPGRRPPGFPIWVDAWVHVRDLDIPEGTPPWKETFLRKNAEFYTAHRRSLDAWVRRWGVNTDLFPASRRKLEWQAQDAARLWDCVMHLRPVGIRAKRATYLRPSSPSHRHQSSDPVSGASRRARLPDSRAFPSGSTSDPARGGDLPTTRQRRQCRRRATHPAQPRAPGRGDPEADGAQTG